MLEFLVARRTQLRLARAAVIGCALLALTAGAAHASHYSVDASGGADFTSIAAAIHQHTLSPRDSILVAPGNYPDTLALGVTVPATTVVGIGGAGATTAASLSVANDWQYGTPWRVVGMTFSMAVTASFGTDFHNCVFLREVTAGGNGCGATNFHDCDFYAPTSLSACQSFPRQVYERLHFHSAPLNAWTGGYGMIQFTDCTFEGPADALVNTSASTDDGISFTRCRFENATLGVIAPDACYFTACVARDITGPAIGYVDLTPPSSHYNHMEEIDVSASRFERCGSAIRWIKGRTAGAILTANTVYASTGDAITVMECYDAGLQPVSGMVVDGGQGHGIVVKLGYNARVGMADCRVQNVAGDGVRIEAPPPGAAVFNSRIWNCQSDHNGGAGYRADAAGVSFSRNVAWANGGDGFEFSPSENMMNRPDTLKFNTSVQNGGAGFNIQPVDTLVDIVQHNLALGNAGVGIQVRVPHRGTFAFNDAWSNTGGAYVGVSAPADSNLTSDPLLCNLAAGDFGLQSGSPCAPTGMYGLIGANPVGCNALAAVPAHVAPLAFSVRPNPMRGAVEFAAFPSGGRVSVVDVQGRRVWGRDVHAGETLRWDGRGQNGRVSPGIYLVHFAGTAGSRVVRLALTE